MNVLRTPLIRAKAFHNIKLSLTIKSFVWFLRTTIDTNTGGQRHQTLGIALLSDYILFVLCVFASVWH
ncbi:MAG: hypothetical protein ACOX3R_07660 [Desulfitobacteriia bacterium]